MNIDTALGFPPNLPEVVIGKYNDGVTTRELDVTWDDFDDSEYERQGMFVVEGTVEGTSIRAVANITVKPLLTVFNMDQLQAGETLEATIIGINKENRSIPVLVSVTLYGSDGRLRDVSYANTNIESEQEINITADLVLPDDIAGNKVKVFVWEGENIHSSNLRPLTSVTELTDNSLEDGLMAPKGLAATPAETPEIIVTWDDVTGATGYDLEVDGTVISDVSSPYVHRGLAYGSSHTYAVRAKNSSGIGAWSKTVSATATSTPSSTLAVEPFDLGDVKLHDPEFRK